MRSIKIFLKDNNFLFTFVEKQTVMKKSFWKSVFSEPGTDEWSWTRMLGTITTLALTVSLILCSMNQFKAPPESLVGALEYISLGSIFGIAAAKFVPKSRQKTNQNTNNDEV